MKTDLFYIYKIEDHLGTEPFEIGPYKHSFFELTYGSGHDVDCKIGASSFKPLKDSLSFATPYQISSWKINSFAEDSLGYMVLFKPEVMGLVLDKHDLYKSYPFFNLHTTPMITLNHPQTVEIIDLMGRLFREHQNFKTEDGTGVLGAYVTLLLEKIKKYFLEKPALQTFGNRAEEITFQFENLLKEKGTYQMKVADYASELHISPIYLSEAVKEITGKAPIHLIQEYLILQAKGILGQTNSTISQVSYELGFSDVSNFAKYFKKRTGQTPNDFRKGIDPHHG
ncbi:MAG: helix-turn-helix transcriptional regulator [Cyclobacteriaceae bacterium]|nr:helix-turn-helix transcriptional regulator [Cyclobacteriaceae bacterium HetDA_MAG_MS6]